MATPTERAKAIFEALADAVVPPPMLKDSLEEYLNRVGGNAGTNDLATDFLVALKKHVVNRVRGQAEHRQAVADRINQSQAANAAANKLPPGLQ